MRKITVVLMSFVFMAFMGLSVSANADQPKPVEPAVVDPTVTSNDGQVVNPCGENVEVCIATTGEGVSEGSEGTGEEIKVCSVDKEGTETCTVEVLPPDGQPVENTVDGQPVDCQKDITVCERTTDGIVTLAPTDGKYEDGIYYMTGDRDLDSKTDTSMVTISVAASSLGLIILGLSINRKIKKN